MSLPATQRGQTLPVVLAALAIALGAMVLSYNGGQQMIAKSRVVNAADAAAYSGAVWAARRMNFMAYTNRAMVGNHAAVGHLITYTSWIRYVEDAATKLNAIGQFIPYVQQATAAAERVATSLATLAQRTAEFYVPTVDTLNSLYSLAQKEARIDLTPPRINSIMRKVVRRHDRQMRLNDTGAIAGLPSPFDAATLALLGSSQIRFIDAVNHYDAGTDDGRIASLVELTLAHDRDLERWMSGAPSTWRSLYGGAGMAPDANTTLGPRIRDVPWSSGERGWQESFILVRFRKQGVTGHTLDRGGARWEADDRFQTSTFDFGKMEWDSWDTLAKGKANSDEFSDSYAGIADYHNLDYDDPGSPRYSVVAVVTLPRSAAAANQAFSMNRSGAPIAYASAAEVEYRRPPACGGGVTACAAGLGKGQDEYSNLFNPFWQARLSGPQLSPTGSGS